MKQDIVAYFSPVTAEEKELLAGNRIDPARYSLGDSGIINAKKLLEKGKLITLRTHTRFVHFPPHTHDFVEMVYMLRGSTCHRINGEELILREGEILFLGRNALQEILPAGEEDIAVNFIILPAFFQTSLEMLGAEDTPIKTFLLDALLDKGGTGYLHFLASDLKPVQNLAENLILSLLSDAPNKQSIARTTMALMFMVLMGHVETLSAPTPETALLSEVYRYLETHFRDGSLEELASLLHLDVAYLSRRIRRATGKTYTDLVREKRLSQAVYLLRHTRLTVEEIALLSGYENKSYFYRIFTARYGTSPKGYREKGEKERE